MSRKVMVAGTCRHMAGWKKDRPDPRDKVYSAPFFARLTLPSSLSLKGRPGLVVVDQGDIGSCTCNSSTSGYMYALGHQGLSIVQPSRLWAYDEVRKREGTPLSEDSGAQIRDVVKMLAEIGCPPESEWPYDTSKLAVDPPDSLFPDAAKHKVLLYFRCGTYAAPSLLAVKSSIAQGFPVVGGFTVPANMQSEECAQTGIVKMPAPDEEMVGGHAVLFTGYDDAKQLLQFQNSWGADWGDGGYGFLPYGFVTGGLADDFWSLRRTTG